MWWSPESWIAESFVKRCVPDTRRIAIYEPHGNEIVAAWDRSEVIVDENEVLLAPQFIDPRRMKIWDADGGRIIKAADATI